MKTRWTSLTVGFVMFLLYISVCTTTTNATVVWTDDFDDGNYNGWTMCSPSWGNPPSNWSAANYYLQIEQEGWGSISHPSNVAYGTWSFDFKANGTEVALGEGVSIAFVSNDVHNATEVPTGDDWSCYGFKALGTDAGFRLYLLKWHGGDRTDIDYNQTLLPVEGWHHIEISRTQDGLFGLYHNGSLVIQGVDTELTTSELIVVSLSDGFMIDNIVVDDEVPTTTTPTSTPPPIDPVLFGLIGGTGVGVVILLAIVYRRRG